MTPFKTEYMHFTELKRTDGSPSRNNLNQFFFEILPDILPSTELDVLDIGCGSGYFVSILNRLHYKGNYLDLNTVEHKDFGQIVAEN